MRLHIVSLPHTETTREYDWCAYTAKVRRFTTMMTWLGHETYLYAACNNEASCTEHVPVVFDVDRKRWFPEWTHEQVWDGFDAERPWWTEMNQRAIDAIRERAQPGDVLGVIAGTCQQQIAEAFPDMFVVEWGVGYSGVFAPFRVFESHAWRHHVAGLQHADDLRWYDAVIPNSFDINEFADAPRSSDGFLLYLGRMTPRKGMEVVQELANRGHDVVTAGQGEVRIEGARHLGLVRGIQKRELLATAKAVLVPTTYLEPFGGVAVEAMMSGTPVITTDWGAFTETVDHGFTGYRCRTLGEFTRAVELVDRLDRREIQQNARLRFSTDVVAHQYQAYLDRLRELEDPAGWYTDDGKVKRAFGRTDR